MSAWRVTVFGSALLSAWVTAFSLVALLLLGGCVLVAPGWCIALCRDELTTSISGRAFPALGRGSDSIRGMWDVGCFPGIWHVSQIKLVNTVICYLPMHFKSVGKGVGAWGVGYVVWFGRLGVLFLLVCYLNVLWGFSILFFTFLSILFDLYY